jgi:hypothetical protein
MIDEHYLFTRGSFGQFELGATDSAAIKTTIGYMGSWATQVGENSAFGPADWINTALAPGGGTFGGQDGTLRNMQLRMFDDDGNKISYFTPRFAGFQLGFSYTPNFSTNGTTANCTSRTGGGNFGQCATNNNSWKRGIDMSANYLNKFGDVSVALYGAYATAAFDRGTISNTGAATPVAAGNAFRRYKTWAAGAQLGFAGFTLGGGLGRDNNGLTSPNATRWYTVSLMYETGPWQMSAGWWGGRNRDGNAVAGTQNAPGKDKLDYFEVGANYALSPGIKLTGGVFYYMGSGQSKSEKADSWAVVFGTALTF